MAEYKVATLGDTIAYCAKHQLLMEMTYNGVSRLIEPYSYRVSQNGDQLFYAFCHKDQKIESFRVDRIEGAKATEDTYIPRYPVESDLWANSTVE